MIFYQQFPALQERLSAVAHTRKLGYSLDAVYSALGYALVLSTAVVAGLFVALNQLLEEVFCPVSCHLCVAIPRAVSSV